MPPANPQLLDSLAAEYVLGTLRGPARRRLARWNHNLPEVQRAVQRWENRLLPLTLALPPIEPSLEVWIGIRHRIKSLGSSSATKGQARDRPWRLAAAAVVLLGLIIALWLGPTPALPPYEVADVTAGNGQLLWHIAVDATQNTLRIRAIAPERHGPREDFELWALPAKGSSPVSLGLMPEQGGVSHRLNAGQREALRAAAKIAVSLEPSGGSPTGAPTGPVVHVADLQRSG
ncbi:MAG TPA: anti-sigma factor [Steroidobacteraceae bacterium]|nr:anti-sigma factor [Steroidobacteraceae bacterium]